MYSAEKLLGNILQWVESWQKLCFEATTMNLISPLTLEEKARLDQPFRTNQYWNKWLDNNFCLEVVPTHRLYLLGLQEAALFEKHFVFPFSSLYSPHKIKVIKTFNFRDEDPRIKYTGDDLLLADVKEELLSQELSDWLERIANDGDLSTPPERSSWFKDLPRIVPARIVPDYSQTERYQHSLYDLDQGLSSTITGLNFIPGIRTTFPSCRGHTAFPDQDAPYFILDIDFKSPSARTLHHNLQVIRGVYTHLTVFLTGDVQVEYKLVKGDALTYTNFWQQVAEIVNESFSERIIPEDKQVQIENFTSETYHHSKTPGDYD
ncbi:MAG TPA: hypothetical protein VJA23_03940 [Candidatus Nanoarchaeia archaeon]|nr:hypothetical protein [Candidatus Nanoarchaeia archaeon]